MLQKLKKKENFSVLFAEKYEVILFFASFEETGCLKVHSKVLDNFWHLKAL